MTCHRLIAADVSSVVAGVRALGLTPAGVPPNGLRWFPSRVPLAGATVTWLDGWPRRELGWPLSCCLELEPSAHGTLAHLSATTLATVGRSRRGVPELALRAWTAHRLSTLAAAVEARGEARVEAQGEADSAA